MERTEVERWPGWCSVQTSSRPSVPWVVYVPLTTTVGCVSGTGVCVPRAVVCTWSGVGEGRPPRRLAEMGWERGVSRLPGTPAGSVVSPQTWGAAAGGRRLG